MASKGQKFNKYTEKQRLEIIQRYVNGELDSNIVEYAEDVLYLVHLLIDNK